jgi:NTE family protein
MGPTRLRPAPPECGVTPAPERRVTPPPERCVTPPSTREPRTVLVLSGGGGKGAFQSGAEETLRERFGLRWDGVIGMSVGAINGAVLAAGEPELLKHTWLTLENSRIYRGNITPLSVLLCAAGLRRSLADNRPMRELVTGTLRRIKIALPLRVIWVDLVTGKPHVTSPADPNFEEALVASANMPVVWRPIKMPGVPSIGVDGQIGGVSPIGAAVSHLDADRVVYVTCRPTAVQPSNNGLSWGIRIALRTLDIVLHEMWGLDIEGAHRINRIVSQTSDTLCSASGRPYKMIELILIGPTQPLGDVLDFSARTNRMRFRHGQEMAEAVMNSHLESGLDGAAAAG